MGHHYVPKFYLRGFEEKGTIWTFDKEQRRVFPSQVKSIANETAMYSEQLESHLANEVEDPAKPALEKVRARKQLTSSDRLTLAKYIVALWKRVPKARLRAIRHMPDVADQVESNLRAELDLLASQDPSSQPNVSALKQHVAEIIARHKESPPPEVWYHSIRSENSPQLINAMLSMTWVFLVSEKDQFLTGDNPVFFFEHEGIGKPTSEITLPLSSSVALWASRTNAPNGQYLKASPSGVREINRRVAQNSLRFIYASRNESWVMPFLERGSWRLTRLRFGNT
jgi:hypothetical protein